MKKSEEADAEQRAHQEKNLHRRAKGLGYEPKKLTPPKAKPMLASVDEWG